MQKTTKVLFHNEARSKILKGVNLVYEAVRMSFGPRGGNALLHRAFNRGARITNDGVTISETIEPLDEFENLVTTAFKEAAKKTNERAGDGTTATTIIAGKLIKDIFSKIGEAPEVIKVGSSHEQSVMEIRKEAMDTKKIVLEKITESAKKIETLEDLEHIAIVSVEDEEIGKIIARMAWEVSDEGRNPDSGTIDVIEGHKGTIETEVIKGMQFPAKVPAVAFVNKPERFEMIAEQVPVLVTDYKLETLRQIEFLNNVLRKDQEAKIAIIAPDFSERVMIEFVQAIKKNFLIFPIKAPSLRTEQYEDICVFTGASFISQKGAGRKIQNAQPHDLGWLEKIIVKNSEARENAVAIGGRGDIEEERNVGDQKLRVISDTQQRIETLRKQIDETKVVSHKHLLEERIASLSSAVGIIRVGATSEAEGLYKKLKIEDAKYACKAALQEGFVRGGGLCLKEIAETLPEDNILRPALLAPYEQLKDNAGGEFIVPNEIIDPAKAIRLAVEHAVSVAAHLATVKVIVAEVREKSPAEGYNNIASAIEKYAYYWAKRNAVYDENQEEMDKDNERQLENYRALGGD